MLDCLDVNVNLQIKNEIIKKFDKNGSVQYIDALKLLCLNHDRWNILLKNNSFVVNNGRWDKPMENLLDQWKTQINYLASQPAIKIVKLRH